MKILMLVNWKIEYSDTIPKDKQPPDYYVKGEPYWFFRYFESEDVEVDVVDCSSFPLLEKIEKNVFRFYIHQTLKCLNKFKNYDLVISHGMQSGVLLALHRRIFGHGKYKHIVFDIGAFNSARESGGALGLMRFASKSIDHVIYHTESQKEYYEKCHPWLLDKSTYIPFGTDADFFSKESEDNMNQGHDDYILCVGYHHRDWDTLTAAYKLSQRRYPLYLLGNSSITVKDDRVRVLPPVNVTEYMKYIREAKFCVLPLQSFNYSFGQMSLLQQMAMGKAVLVADVPSMSAYVGDDANLTYKSEDVTDLTYKLNLLMNDDELRESMGIKASKAVQQKYNEKEMALKIEKVLLNL